MFDPPIMVGAATAAPPREAPTLRLFDGFRLECESTNITVSSNGQRLIAFLALRGETTRADCAGTLWSDVTEARANGSLRTTIWRLNRSGIRLVESRAQILALAPEIRVDVRTFITATSHIDQLLQSEGDHGQILSGGELLPGWYEDWVLFERERLRQLRLHALEALAKHLAARRQYARALEAALQCVHLEPLRESAHREVLAIHLAEQNVAEALRHYELFRKLMHDEMGIEPSAQLRQMLPERYDMPPQRMPTARPG